jgi:hypothetical protein
MRGRGASQRLYPRCGTEAPPNQSVGLPYAGERARPVQSLETLPAVIARSASDKAIQGRHGPALLDCFAALAMTVNAAGAEISGQSRATAALA